eukprot:TRINITY_DN1486_c0_g1_i1.p1 TRINITY_DN1486_c0_g1~~TRINITY_DN1486_c0_g1_i1.p1  ORF type:complete len:538 (-),score=120.72 TRINITY_DN1486_c0_g1_i1:45-1658(-)
MSMNNNIMNSPNPKKLLACSKCYKLHRKCTGESRPCDYCKERKLECIENPDRKKRGRPKGSKNKYKSAPQFHSENNGISNFELQNIIEIQRKRNINHAYQQPTPYNPHEIQDPRLYVDYQKRQKIVSNDNYSLQYPPNQYINQNNTTIPPQYQINNNNMPYYNNLIITPQPQYLPPRVHSPINMHPHQQHHHHHHTPHHMQPQEEQYEQTHFPPNDFPNTYPPTNHLSEEIPQSQMLEDISHNHKIPINHQQRRDIIFTPEKSSSANIDEEVEIKFCIKCNTDMQTFKFCPHCGTPREKVVEQHKSLVPSISRKKLLSLAILEIVNENNSSFGNNESSLQTIWFVVKHSRPKYNQDNSTESNSPSNNTSGMLGDFSLHSTSIKQVSPNWTNFLGYKQSETEKISLSKFVPSRVELSPKISSVWDSLYDHTSRNSTVNMSCEFVLCHKFGLMFGVDLQITCFSSNGLPDTSFIVVKKHWNLNKVSEASLILNHPNLQFFNDKSLHEEEEEDDEEPSINDPNFELLRKAVDFKKSIDLI